MGAEGRLGRLNTWIRAAAAPSDAAESSVREKLWFKMVNMDVTVCNY